MKKSKEYTLAEVITGQCKLLEKGKSTATESAKHIQGYVIAHMRNLPDIVIAYKHGHIQKGSRAQSKAYVRCIRDMRIVTQAYINEQFN